MAIDKSDLEDLKEFISSEFTKRDELSREFLSNEFTKRDKTSREFLSNEFTQRDKASQKTMSDGFAKQDETIREFISSEFAKQGKELRDDMKQYISAEVYQQVHGVVNDAVDGLRQEMNERFDRVDERFEEQDEKLDEIMNAVGEDLAKHTAKLDDHGERLVRLERKAA